MISRCHIRQKRLKNTLRYLQGQRELEALKKQITRVYITAHAQIQIKRRKLTALDIKRAFKNALLVERQEGHGRPIWLVLVMFNNRPVHLVISKTGKHKLIVITAYDPSREPWRWTSDYRRRAS